MDEFKVIDVMNEAKLKLLKEKNMNYNENLKIREILKDEAIFFKINKLDAYNILKKVGIKQEKLDDVYIKLTSSNIFYDLLNKGKINANDEKLVIKYNIYNKDDLFKNKK